MISMVTIFCCDFEKITVPQNVDWYLKILINMIFFYQYFKKITARYLEEPFFSLSLSLYATGSWNPIFDGSVVLTMRSGEFQNGPKFNQGKKISQANIRYDNYFE